MVRLRKPKEPVIESTIDRTYFFCDWCNFGHRLDLMPARDVTVDLTRKAITFTCPDCNLSSAIVLTSEQFLKR